jgi:hypothetical protein
LFLPSSLPSSYARRALDRHFPSGQGTGAQAQQQHGRARIRAAHARVPHAHDGVCTAAAQLLRAQGCALVHAHDTPALDTLAAFAAAGAQFDLVFDAAGGRVVWAVAGCS